MSSAPGDTGKNVCVVCERVLPPATSPKGRKRLTCSDACRQELYRRRRHARRYGPAGD